MLQTSLAILAFLHPGDFVKNIINPCVMGLRIALTKYVINESFFAPICLPLSFEFSQIHPNSLIGINANLEPAPSN